MKIAKRFLAFSVLLLALSAISYFWHNNRALSFDRDRWCNATSTQERWRMVDDLQNVLRAKRPTYDETLSMLEGELENKDQYRSMHKTSFRQQKVLVYWLRRKPRTTVSGQLLLRFDDDGKFYGSQVIIE